MRHPLLLSAVSFLSIIGIADSFYLAQHALTDTALSCGIDGALSGCNEVAQSVYSHVFGIPLGIYGLVFYVAVFIFSLLMRTRHSHVLSRLMLLAAFIGIALSAYFVLLQVFVIKALCIYCMISAVCSAGIFACALMLYRVRHPKMEAA